MAGGSYFVWIPILLCSLFQASEQGIPEMLQSGIHPENTRPVPNAACPDAERQLAQLKSQLQQATLQNSQMDAEAFGFRREVRLLKMQLEACSSTASTISGSYRTQLLNKMKQNLQTFDSDPFLILKVTALSREVNSLQRKIQQAANSTDTTTDITPLQRELQVKTGELNAKMQQIERSHKSTPLIMQIISLQNQIWDLEQARLKDSSPLPDRRILALQTQLTQKISQLQAQGDGSSATLELIFVNSKIATLQRLISIRIEESKTISADYQRQRRQKSDLLKRMIMQLNRDENNTTLTMEIFRLQGELDSLSLNEKRKIDAQITELRAMLEQERKRQDFLQKQLEEEEYAQAQMIIKVINIMKEVRELKVDEQDQTTQTNPATTLQTLLQTKEREYAIAQDKIRELQDKLRLQREKSTGLEEDFEQAKTEFDQKVAELSRTGDVKSAEILSVMNLHDELMNLRELISTTSDPRRILELQRQLEEKQDSLKSKTEGIGRLTVNPKKILTIIELQKEISDLQNKPVNETNVERIKELQRRVDGLISEIDNRSEGDIKLMLKIITLQRQVQQLQTQLSDLQMLKTGQENELRDDLATKTQELQRYVTELKEKNQTHARLILKITDLHNQLRKLENTRQNDNTISSLTITQLREQLKTKRVQHTHDEAEIRALQALCRNKERELTAAQAEVRELKKKLRSKSEECSGLEDSYEQAKTEFEQKIEELNRGGDSEAALVLDVINLHDELKNLRELISTTKDPKKIAELQRQLVEKQNELNSRTEDIERTTTNPKIILTVIELQDEIYDLQRTPANENNAKRVKDLQTRVDTLISEIDDRSDEDIKQVLKIISLQSQVQQLQKQLSDLQTSQTDHVTQLRNDLETKTNDLQQYVTELDEKNQTNARLILTVTDLHNQLRNLTKEKHTEGRTTSVTLTKLREQLKEKTEERLRDRAEIEALQNQLNQTEAQCSNFEQQLTDVQNDLDAKMNELQSKSDTVTSLALQVSTLTLQLEELKRQLQNTDSETKIKELQKIIDEKTNELAKKTAALKARSTQPQRILQIIEIQTEIEKLSKVAANDTDYNKLRALQDHVNYLIEGIQDENSENTKLMFKILSQKDEIARLNRQAESQAQAEQQKIKDLEDELENVRNQIKEKTQVLDSSDTRIANLSAQIMELHKKIRPLEDEIADLKEASAENLEELQSRMALSEKQLQDSELRLKEADEKNFKSITEITELRAKLKKVQRQAARATRQNVEELEQQIETQQRENKKLENANKDLKKENEELNLCCNAANNQCDDLERQLQQSHEDADSLQRQLNQKDANLKHVQGELQELTKENDDLKNKYGTLERQHTQTQDAYNNLQQQLEEKDARLNEMEEKVEELEGNLTDVENKKIHTKRVTFNPDTANPRIVFSADKTEMTSSAEPQDVPDNPGRFDVLLAALGKTGYSAGRNYWEVSVAGALCFHIGMASETAQRKGTVRFRPANGFWTITLNKQGRYTAFDSTPTTLSVSTQPATLGILLDYKKGQISFYDAGARSHLYTFTGQSFTGKIYPFVNFCVQGDTVNHAPIRLVTPGAVDWIK